MTLKKGRLMFSQEDGWVIHTFDGNKIKVHKDYVIEFGLKKTTIITVHSIISIDTVICVSGLMSIPLAWINQQIMQLNFNL